LQIALLLQSMQAALQAAVADHKAATAGLLNCQASVHKCEQQQKHTTIASETTAASSRAAAAQLKVELESSKLALKQANEKLQKQEQQNKEAQDRLGAHASLQHSLEAQVEVLQAQLREELAAVLKAKQQQEALRQEKDQLLKDKQQLQQV
jgi:chromosome segregation ATPase